jgi:homoserine O-acetyltransferase
MTARGREGMTARGREGMTTRDDGLTFPYWRAGGATGDRQFASIGVLELEVGGKLSDVQIAYETWGTFTGANAVLVEHALTGDSHVVGPAGPGHPTAGWWDGLVGPGRAIDTNRWFVVASNVLGGCQGSTGPSSPAPDGDPYGSRFPVITVRDQVSAERALADVLDVDRWALVVGGSMGGMRALEWAVEYPSRVERLAVVATSAAATAEQIALCSAQIHAIAADQHWLGGDYYGGGAPPLVGLGIARRIAHISYRSESELALRFGRLDQDGETALDGSGRFAVESYLDHQANKLIRRFDAGSYVALTRAMNTHDLGRGRGGLLSAMKAITAQSVVMAVNSDRLYLPAQQLELAAGITGATLVSIDSPYGHDGFLIESDQVGAQIARLLS